MRFRDLNGVKFGRLLAIRVYGISAGKTDWLCACDCGAAPIVRGTHLTAGKVKSCGCFANERVAQLNKTHGLSKTRTYRIWRNMLNRCYYEKHREFKYWGGRGITVCNDWRKSFMNFYQSMGEAPSWASIDRIDNDGNYEERNCRWATNKEQAQNKGRKAA